MIVGWMFRFLRVTSDSNLADLLPDRLPYLLPVAGLCENGRILPLANFDSRSKKRGKQSPGKDSKLTALRSLALS